MIMGLIKMLAAAMVAVLNTFAPAVNTPGAIVALQCSAARTWHCASTVPQTPGLPHVVALRYDRSGRQLTCQAAERGWYGLVFGDGRYPFTVRCSKDGHSYAWETVK